MPALSMLFQWQVFSLVVLSDVGVTVSHVTGSVSRIAIAMFNEDFDTFALVLSIVASFMFGCFVSGFIVGDGKFRLSRWFD